MDSVAFIQGNNEKTLFGLTSFVSLLDASHTKLLGVSFGNAVLPPRSISFNAVVTRSIAFPILVLGFSDTFFTSRTKIDLESVLACKAFDSRSEVLSCLFCTILDYLSPERQSHQLVPENTASAACWLTKLKYAQLPRKGFNWRS